MLHRNDLRMRPIVCAICGGDEFDHDRVTGECHVYRRADVKPYALRRRDKTPATGWKVRAS